MTGALPTTCFRKSFIHVKADYKPNVRNKSVKSVISCCRTDTLFSDSDTIADSKDSGESKQDDTTLNSEQQKHEEYTSEVKIETNVKEESPAMKTDSEIATATETTEIKAESDVTVKIERFDVKAESNTQGNEACSEVSQVERPVAASDPATVTQDPLHLETPDLFVEAPGQI